MKKFDKEVFMYKLALFGVVVITFYFAYQLIELFLGGLK